MSAGWGEKSLLVTPPPPPPPSSLLRPPERGLRNSRTNIWGGAIFSSFSATSPTFPPFLPGIWFLACEPNWPFHSIKLSSISNSKASSNGIAAVLLYFPGDDGGGLGRTAFLLRSPTTGIIHQRAESTPTTAASGEYMSRTIVLPDANHTADRTLILTRNKVSPRPESSPEAELSRARAAIRRAAAAGNASLLSASGVRRPNVYRNEAAFFRSYAEMERRFKVYVYEEGEPPLVHDGPCKDIYTTEGRFIQEMEMTPTAESSSGDLRRRRSIRTRDPHRAHAYFLPFSVAMLVHYVYPPLSQDHSTIKRFIADYINVLASKHPYWNRTSGADHFMLSCHDWGPHSSQAKPELYNNSIRALCNANATEGFQPGKDVSIPEVNLRTGEFPPQLATPPPDSAPRPYLAFFAGGLHGYIRRVLLERWKGKDDDMQVFEYLPAGLDYFSFMRRSKFCLCPSGFEVASPRIVESIYAECVPVVISDAYVLPFSDVLRWEEFSVAVAVKDIPRLKEVLAAVPEAEVRRLREGVRAVRRHFVFNHPAKRFDVFHMILHSVWLRRLNLRLG